MLAERDSDQRRVIEILCALVKLYTAVEDWGQAAKYADELLDKSKNHRRIEPQIMYFELTSALSCLTRSMRKGGELRRAVQFGTMWRDLAVREHLSDEIINSWMEMGLSYLEKMQSEEATPTDTKNAKAAFAKATQVLNESKLNLDKKEQIRLKIVLQVDMTHTRWASCRELQEIWTPQSLNLKKSNDYHTAKV